MFIRTAKGLVERGARGLLLGSTDLGFVLQQQDFEVPVFDAAEIHSKGVVDWAMGIS